MKRFFLIVVLALVYPCAAWAYSDRVDAPAQEIYTAALGCFEQDGIYKTDPAQHSLVTKWQYETIRRTRKRQFIPTMLKETVEIRYQMQMDIDEGDAYSDVSIRGRFEEKRADAPPMQPWKYSSSSKELYFKEREVFFRLLKCVEEHKTAGSQSASVPDNP